MLVSRVTRVPAVRHAVGLQAAEFGQSELHRMETEYVGNQGFDLLPLPLE